MTRIVSYATSSQYCPSTEFKAAIYSLYHLLSPFPHTNKEFPQSNTHYLFDDKCLLYVRLLLVWLQTGIFEVDVVTGFEQRRD